MIGVTIKLIVLSVVMLIVVMLGVGVQAIQILRSFELQIFRQFSQMAKGIFFVKFKCFLIAPLFSLP